jgi:hypothetical protein
LCLALAALSAARSFCSNSKVIFYFLAAETFISFWVWELQHHHFQRREESKSVFLKISKLPGAKRDITFEGRNLTCACQSISLAPANIDYDHPNTAFSGFTWGQGDLGSGVG